MTYELKVADVTGDVAAGDVVFCPPQVVREWKASEDGLGLLAFGGHVEGDGDVSP